MGWGWGTNKQVITWSAGAREFIHKRHHFLQKQIKPFIVRGLEADVKQENFVAPHIPSSIQSFNKNMIMSSPCPSSLGHLWSSDTLHSYQRVWLMIITSGRMVWRHGAGSSLEASHLLAFPSDCSPSIGLDYFGWSPVYPSFRHLQKLSSFNGLTPPVISSPQYCFMLLPLE